MAHCVDGVDGRHWREELRTGDIMAGRALYLGILVAVLALSSLSLYLTSLQAHSTEHLGLPNPGIRPQRDRFIDEPAEHVQFGKLSEPENADAVTKHLSKVIHVRHAANDGGFVRLGHGSSDTAVQEAIYMAVDIASDTGFALKSNGPRDPGVFAAASFDSLLDGERYTVITVPAAGISTNVASTTNIQTHNCNNADPEARPQELQGILGKSGFVLSAHTARLPRVVLTALGTGRYRPMAIDALLSAIDFFGGDCEPSFHLLTDNTSGVDPKLNAAHAPYREWPESGLSKFEDIKNALGSQISNADYFFFMDADIRFKDRVELGDVAGDLVGVEHPMYPRYDFGWCKPGKPETRGFCAYPFCRNNESTAFIPWDQGRFVKEGKYVVSNAYYFQSAFWGGKSEHVLPLLDELIPRINTNRENGVYSKIIQDELFLNWYLWKHSNDSNLNIRVLSPSYLYPSQTHGFTEWVTKENRPIIVHGIGKKSGKLINGATELFCVGLRKCVDMFAGTGWSKVGFYNCHHVADSQGLLHEKDTKHIRSMASGIHRCFDASELRPGEDLKFLPCNDSNLGMKWIHDPTTKMIKNPATSLCIDPLREPGVAGDPKKPLGVNNCDKDSSNQQFDFRPI